MRKKLTKTYKNYKDTLIKTRPIINTVKTKPNISTIKPPKYVRCDPTGAALTVVVIGCLVVAAGGACAIIWKSFKALTTPVAPIIKEIIPGSMASILAQVCPKPEVREALLAIDPDILKVLCSTIDTVKIAHAWLEHTKIPFLEAIPKVNGADPSAVAHYYHELLRWTHAQNFNENAWRIVDRVERYVRWGIFENGRLLRSRNLQNQVIFLKSTDFAPCPREYLQAFSQQALELHPRHVQTGDAQRWAIHNEIQFSRRGVVATLTSKEANWYYASGEVWSMYLNSFVDNVTGTAKQLAAFRDSVVDPSVYNEAASYQTEQLWHSKNEWVEKYCLDNPVNFSLDSGTNVKTPNNLKEVKKYMYVVEGSDRYK